MLSAAEVEYLKGQRLCRIATASPECEPEVSPVAFEYDGKYFYVGSQTNQLSSQLEDTRTSRVGIHEFLLS